MGRDFKKHRPTWYKQENYKELKSFTRKDWLEQLILRFFVNEKANLEPNLINFLTKIKRLKTLLLSYKQYKYNEEKTPYILKTLQKITFYRFMFNNIGYTFSGTRMFDLLETLQEMFPAGISEIELAEKNKRFSAIIKDFPDIKSTFEELKKLQHPIQIRCKDLIKLNGIVRFKDLIRFSDKPPGPSHDIKITTYLLNKLFPKTYHLLYEFKKHFPENELSISAVRGLSSKEVDLVDKKIRKLESQLIHLNQNYQNYSELIGSLVQHERKEDEFNQAVLKPVCTEDGRLLVSINLAATITQIKDEIERAIAEAKNTYCFSLKDYSGEKPSKINFIETRFLQIYDLQLFKDETSLKPAMIASIANETYTARIPQTISKHLKNLKNFENLRYLIYDDSITFDK